MWRACRTCGKTFNAPDDLESPTPEQCPSCRAETAPAKEQHAPPAVTGPPRPDEYIFCSKCGTRNLENNYQCTECGTVLHTPPRTAYVPDDNVNTMGVLFPYKNALALVSYYCGVFSLIPGIGAFLGVAAVVCGIGGLRHAARHPEAKGKVHAWVGIILGGLFALVHVLLIIMFFAATVSM